MSTTSTADPPSIVPHHQMSNSNPASSDTEPQDINLNCVIFGDGPGQVFQISIAQNKKVCPLRRLVREKLEPRLDAIAPRHIRLFKVDLCYEGLGLDDFKDKVQSAIQPPENCLSPVDRLYEIFPDGSPQSGNLHIVAVLPGNIVTPGSHFEFNCVIYGEHPDRVFRIKIGEGAGAYILKNFIKEAKKPSLDAINAKDLRLFKVDLPEYKNLGLDDFKGKIRGVLKKSLYPGDKLETIFPSGSPQDENLHIVVLLPSGVTEHRLAAEAAAINNGSIFHTDAVQDILEEMGYDSTFVVLGHPCVAIVSGASDEPKTGFLKVVRDGHEPSILKYLSKIDSPRNHTVAGVRFWPVRGGQMFFMPSAGSWLTSLRNPDAHLRSVARQLFEAVDFMHQHGVAHMDLKPANVLIPIDGGRVSIIDFQTSVRIEGVNAMLSEAIGGTPGYIPPEVVAESGPFNAVRADLWSCGKTLSELCNLCQPSVDRDALLQISRELMDENPEKRPMMSDVLERIANAQSIPLGGSDAN